MCGPHLLFKPASQIGNPLGSDFSCLTTPTSGFRLDRPLAWRRFCDGGSNPPTSHGTIGQNSVALALYLYFWPQKYKQNPNLFAWLDFRTILMTIVQGMGSWGYTEVLVCRCLQRPPNR